jgi:sortase A
MGDTETTSPNTLPAGPPGDEAPVAALDDAPVATPSHAARRRLLRRTASLLLIAGGLVLAFPFWSSAYTRTQQGRLNESYTAASTAFAADAAAQSAATAHDLSEQARLERLAGLFEQRVKVGSAVARLKIPRIGFDRVVVQGTGGRDGLSPTSDQDLLRSGPVHYATTPLPGLGEPFAVAGHRTTYGAPFYHLNELKKGDPVYVETPYARFTYRVEKLSEVQPSDTSVLADRGYGLVLTTCTPLYSASRRLIVWAVAERFTLK